MPQGVTYDVNAFLRTQGSFTKEMAGAARGADQLGKSYGSMSDRLVAGGERVRGTFGATMRDMARAGVMAGAAGLAGGIAYAAREGIRFNNSMEQGALGLGTMYTTFGLMADSADVSSGKMTLFTKSVEQAEAMQSELFDIAKKSPATFEQVATAYKSMAPSISGVTGDLTRQRDLMANMSLLGFATGDDYKQLGMDIGRIVKGMAEMDNLTFQQMRPAFEKAFEAVTGDAAVNDFNAQWNKAAKLDPEQALRIVEMVGEQMGGEVSDAFGASFGGMAATIQSQGQVLAGAFGKPLMESMKKSMAVLAGDDSPFGKLEEVAAFAGQQLAKAADVLFGKMIKGANYIADNYEMIAKKIQEAGVLAGVALKAASVVATARLVAGYGMIAVGKGAAAAKAVGGGMGRMGGAWRDKAKQRHMAIGRGMAGRKGGGGLGMMGRGMGKVFGGVGKGGLGIFRGLDKFALKAAAVAPMIASASVAMGGLVFAFSGVALIVGGLAAYMITNWDEIKTSIRTAIEDGRITLVPLITSLYTFWERLKLVGEAIFGTINPATAMAGGLDMLTTAVDFASGVLGGMIRVVAYGIEAWGALKLALAAVFQLIGDGLRIMAKIPSFGIGSSVDGAVASLDKMSQTIHDSAQDTFQQADQFKQAADAIASAQLTPMQLAAAKKKAKDLEGALSDMLSGKDEKKDGRKGRQTKIEQNIVINTNDPDVDRLMAGFISAAERQSDKPVQSQWALGQGS